MRSVQIGILLKKLNYSETSLILHFYTLEEGFKPFLFQGGKKKKGNILHPLSIVEIESYQRPDSELGKISSISPQPVLQSIPIHPVKGGLAFFLTELIAQCLKSSDSDQRMFRFLIEEIKWLDNTSEVTNYPIWFLLKFAYLMGFSPHVLEEKPTYFDLQEGELTRFKPKGHVFIEDTTIPILEELLNKQKSEFMVHKMNKTTRKQLINNLIDYYKQHISNFKTPKSLEVMQTVFNE
jgi:DNA repair protein RecO (recombination protein O)